MKFILISKDSIEPLFPSYCEDGKVGYQWCVKYRFAAGGRRRITFILGKKDFPDENSPPVVGQSYRPIELDKGVTIFVNGEDDGSFLTVLEPHPGPRGGCTIKYSGEIEPASNSYLTFKKKEITSSDYPPVYYVRGPCVIKWVRHGTLPIGDNKRYCTAIFDGKKWSVQCSDVKGDF